jgi:hypothetical protein
LWNELLLEKIFRVKRTPDTTQMNLRYKIVQELFILGVLLGWLIFFFAFQLIQHKWLPYSDSIKYFLVFISGLTPGLLSYKIALLYDDRIIIKYPLLFFRKEFLLGEVKAINITVKFNVRIITFKLTRRVLFFKFTNFEIVTISSPENPIDSYIDIYNYLKEKQIRTKTIIGDLKDVSD